MGQWELLGRLKVTFGEIKSLLDEFYIFITTYLLFLLQNNSMKINTNLDNPCSGNKIHQNKNNPKHHQTPYCLKPEN